MARRRQRITPEKRREVIWLAAQGASYRRIVDELDVSSGSVGLVLVPLGGASRKETWETVGRGLTLEERIEIHTGLEKSQSLRAIARRIKRHPATVSREVKRNGGPHSYRPMEAQRRARDNQRRPKITKLAANSKLCGRVVDDLRRLWSPEQIAACLAEEFGDDDSMRISHETIYKTLYLQGRGELRRELAACLRTGRARRVKQGRVHSGSQIADMVMISERPAEAQDRAVPGHWEGDLLVGKRAKSAIGTLVERSTRFVMLFPLPNGRSAEQVRQALTETMQTLPAALRRSLTWDQGREMAEHVRFRIDSGLEVFFCDPHSPWQRGSNENTNGLLRQYFPKGIDLSGVSVEDLETAADGLNGRPRKTLGWRTPAEKLSEFVASTD